METKQIYKVTEEPALIKSKLSAHMKGYFLPFMAGIIIVYIILNWVPQLMQLRFPTSWVEVYSHFYPIDEELKKILPKTPLITFLYGLVFNGVLKLGEVLYCLTFLRNRKVEYEAIFESTGFWLKAMGLFIVQSFIIGMWSMLFVIPGIIAALNYSLSFYILSDNPDKKIFEILSESKIHMLGNRVKYLLMLVLYLPFILLGYAIAMVPYLFKSIDVTAFPGVILALVSALPFYCARGYITLATGTFYELVMNAGFENFKYAGQEEFRKPDAAFTDF